MSSTRWKVAWNSSAQFLGKLVGAAATFLTSVMLARAFGADGYGDFVKVVTYVSPFYLLADFGMNAIYLQKEGASWQELFGVRLVGSATLAFLAMAILAFLPQGVGQGYTAGVRLGIILFLPTIVFQAIITTTNALFQQWLAYDRATASIAVGSVVTVALVWLLVRLGLPGALLALEAGTIATAVAALVFVRVRTEALRPVVAVSSFLSYATRSLPLGITLVCNLIYVRADHLILALTRPTAEVGIYGLAYKVFEFPLAIPTFFMNSVYPIMLATLRKKEEAGRMRDMKVLLGQLFMVLILMSFILVLLLWFASPLFSVLRPEFAQSAPVLRVLSLGLPFFFLTSLTMWTMVAMKKHGTLATIYGAAMAQNVLLNAWLVPRFGSMAAAWVTVACEAAVLVWSAIIVGYDVGIMKRRT